PPSCCPVTFEPTNAILDSSESMSRRPSAVAAGSLGAGVASRTSASGFPFAGLLHEMPAAVIARHRPKIKDREVFMPRFSSWFVGDPSTGTFSEGRLWGHLSDGLTTFAARPD